LGKAAQKLLFSLVGGVTVVFRYMKTVGHE
jgi:hypothetical protein